MMMNVANMVGEALNGVLIYSVPTYILFASSTMRAAEKCLQFVMNRGIVHGIKS